MIEFIDEKLSAQGTEVLREYIEVERNAEIGELVEITKVSAEYPGDFSIGDICEVLLERNRWSEGSCMLRKRDGSQAFIDTSLGESYRVLEPTNIIRIGDKRYGIHPDAELAIGDTVIITKEREYACAVGDTGVVAFFVFDGDAHVRFSNGKSYFVGRHSGNSAAAKIVEIKPPPSKYSSLLEKFAEAERIIAEQAAEIETLKDAAKERTESDAEVVTPDIARQEAIKAAKKYVEDTLGYQEFRWVPVSELPLSFIPFFGSRDNIEFVVNREKRTIAVLIRNTGGKVWARGKAKCDPNDVFNEHLGKAIALQRALGVTVRDDFVNAPQPKTIVTGMLTRVRDTRREYIISKEVVFGSMFLSRDFAKGVDYLDIVDDTNAEYSETLR